MTSKESSNLFPLAQVLAALCLTAHGFAALPAGHDLADIRAANELRLSAMRTVVVTEIIREQRKIDDKVIDERRRERARAVLEHRDFEIKAAVGRKNEQDAIKAANDAADSQLESIDEKLVLDRLNAETAIRRTTTIDIAGRRIRRDDVDNRDLDALVQKHGLGKSERYSLEKTGSAIMDGDKPEIRLHTQVGKLATLMSYRSILWDNEMMGLGAVPARVFSDEVEVDARPDDNKEIRLGVRNRKTSFKEAEITVAPRFGYAVTKIVFFSDGGGAFKEFEATDFRETGGVFLPFRTRVLIHSPLPSFYMAERDIKEIKVNSNVPDFSKLFSIPSDFHVEDISKP